MSGTARPRLKRQFSVIAHSANIVELRQGVWNPVAYTFTDESATGRLSRVLALLDGQRTLPEIAKTAEVKRGDVEAVVEQLAEMALIEDSAHNALDHYLDFAVPNLLPFGGRPSAPVGVPVIAGQGTLPAEVAAILARCLPATTIEVAGPDHQLVRRLGARRADWLHDGFAFERYAEEFADWRGRTVIWAADTVRPDLLCALNRICLHHQITWLHASADGPFLLVGPAFQPYRTACYECLDTRVLMNLRESGSYQRYKQALAAGRVHGGLAPLDAILSSILAAHTAMEALNLLTTGATVTLGKLLAIYVPTMEFTFSDVLRLPGCPACAPVPESDDRELYFEVRSLLDGAVPEQGR